MKGIIVFNVDVGQASLDTVDRIVRQKKEEWGELMAKLIKNGYETIVLTNRIGSNTIQKIEIS